MSSDDDIEIIEKHTVDPSISGNDDLCQLCSADLRGLKDADRKDHYQQHKSGAPISARATKRTRPRSSVDTSQRKTTPMKFNKSPASNTPEDVFWYPAQAEAPPDNYTPGILSILKDSLKQSHRKGATQRAVLCYERTPHIFRETFDVAWGCGYRNFLMSCAALMDQPLQTLYSAYLNDPISPSVRNLQRWLEDAWKNGYDEIGARQLGHKLVDTKTKLGTGDLYVAFTSRKIPCKLADFDLQNSPKGLDTLIEWVVNYFTERPEGNVNEILRNASPVVAINKMPLILQYDGHSVTIVGYELAKSGKYNLLVFNPSSKVEKNVRQAALSMSASVGWASSSSVSLGKTKHRDRSKSPVPKKRPRTNQDPDDGIVSIADSEDESLENARRAIAPKPNFDPDKVVKAFKWGPPKLKHQFQLLYFTMGDPLSAAEQNACKVVYSDKEY